MSRTFKLEAVKNRGCCEDVCAVLCIAQEKNRKERTLTCDVTSFFFKKRKKVMGEGIFPANYRLFVDPERFLQMFRLIHPTLLLIQSGGAPDLWFYFRPHIVCKLLCGNLELVPPLCHELFRSLLQTILYEQ